MAKFIAVKVHYDHRDSLPAHLKYSRLPNREEYEKYLRLYREDGVGGDGFHECVNFHIPGDRPVRMYLTPTNVPSQKLFDEEFVIFSFTYKTDKEQSSHIVGIHAGARILSGEGLIRTDIQSIKGLEPFKFHVEAPGELVTLFTPSVEYDVKAGIHTPRYGRDLWGNGLRHLNESHAAAIVNDALAAAEEKVSTARGGLRLVVEREIETLKRIKERYSLGEVEAEHGTKKKSASSTSLPIPDKELGDLGEKEVYERELKYVRSIGLEPCVVEWVSQSVPLSPFDIKSVRKTEAGIEERYIEVKSTRSQGCDSIFISSGQIAHFEEHEDTSRFVFIRFGEEAQVDEYRELTLSDLRETFDLLPIKYRLRKR